VHLVERCCHSATWVIAIVGVVVVFVPGVPKVKLGGCCGPLSTLIGAQGAVAVAGGTSPDTGGRVERAAGAGSRPASGADVHGEGPCLAGCELYTRSTIGNTAVQKNSPIPTSP
jgi:hypothetical protein